MRNSHYFKKFLQSKNNFVRLYNSEADQADTCPLCLSQCADDLRRFPYRSNTFVCLSCYIKWYINTHYNYEMDDQGDLKITSLKEEIRRYQQNKINFRN